MNLSDIELAKEKSYLEKALKELRSQISDLGQQLYDREEKIQEFKKFVWDSKHDMDPTEMKSVMLENDLQVVLVMAKAKHYQKLFKIQNNPYFGSITFKEDDFSQKIYIGITHLEDIAKEEYLIHDWRAPISSMFYDYGVGAAEYLAPGGVIKGSITNKRQFKIEGGKIKRVFDNNLNVDDDLLQEVLSMEANDKMKNIVNTIQEEQNAVIRNVTDKNLIVQGIAGSGKTSVALHRIAFLLYKLENLNSKNVLIFSPNQVFLEYISNVLPELGEDNTMQTTFHEFLSNSLKEYKSVESFTTFVERYYKYIEPNKGLVKYKQSDEIIIAIHKYAKAIIKSAKFTKDIENNDYEISKEKLNYFLNDRYQKLSLVDRLSEIADKINLDYCNNWKSKKLSILKHLKDSLNIKLDYKKLYREFYESEYFINSYGGNISQNEINSTTNKKDINYEDACLMVYLKGLLEGFNYRGLIKEIVIDEAQDYNKLQYILIRNIFKKSSFTILGDVNQTINPYYKYESLEEIIDILGKDTKYLELTKTYRSSPLIIEYTNKILGIEHVSAIRRENNLPVKFRDVSLELKNQLVNDIREMQKENFTIAIITKTDEEALKLYELLKTEVVSINILNSTTKEFNKKLVIVPSYIAKGLEFDSVIIYTDKDNKYKDSEKYLYYVACTRAQHQLIIYNQKS